ncbi:MAG: 1-acyl-sn-glycerol-3-phosphate acyltransferase [Planctomycetes bacterium]|nr:1-acyl-sn-glycerol-3-phosphate acyltransferase [Planctomycetota bacterium]MCW8136754.1 1-acyl-sn-glycerol-3-phosphate acyltransferase [Planctomycetota bacterium]
MARDEHVLVDLTRPTGWRGWVYHTAVNFAAALGRVLLFWQPIGTHNIPRTGPLLVVANHPSYLEPPTLVALMIYYADRDLSIMAWDKLFRIPIVSFFTRNYKAFPVNRSNPGRGPYVTLVRILEQGGAAGVFPEGSRSEGRLMGDWKPGALRAAFATKATILPISFVTVGEFWPKSRWRPWFFRKHIQVVHPPLTYERYIADMPPGMREKEYQEVLERRIRDMINQPLLERQRAWQQHVLEKSRSADRLDEPDPIRQRREMLQAAAEALKS